MRARSLLASVAVLGLVLVACDTDDGVDLDAPDPDDVDETEPADPDTDEAEPDELQGTLRAAIGGDPDQLDPHETTAGFAFTVLENVYDTLVQPGDDLTMEPALAEDWETSDDLQTVTFFLREGVTFHDGSEFDADDVVASFEHIGREGGPNAWRLDAIDEVVATDELTVEFRLNRPAPNLLEQIGAFKGMAIAPADALEAGTLGDEPVGTGPFQLVSFTPGDSIVLEAYPDYWGPGPFLEGIEFQVIPDDGVKLTGLQTGELDWIDSVPPQEIDTLDDDADVVLSRVAGNDYWYIALNNEREPFDDVDVRRAVAFGIDIEAITEGALFGAGTPNETAIPETSFWFNPYAPYNHQPDQAQELLDDAGVDGLTMDLMITTEFPETVTAAQIISSQLAEIGIEVEIRTLDFATWLDEQGQGNFDAFLLGWLGNIDPDDFYYAQHHSEGAFNFHGFSDPEVDELLDAGRTEVDEDARKEIYDDAAERIVDQASYIYLYNPDIVEAWSQDVAGYVTRPDVATRFNETRLQD